MYSLLSDVFNFTLTSLVFKCNLNPASHSLKQESKQALPEISFPKHQMSGTNKLFTSLTRNDGQFDKIAT